MASLNNFTEIFKEEKNLWVKTLVPGQVIITVNTSPGNTKGVLVPSNGDPICLNNEASWDGLKSSMDLRHLAAPRRFRDGSVKPPAIKIMDEEEVRAYYARKAERRGWLTPEGEPDVARAMTPVYTRQGVDAPSPMIERDAPRDEPTPSTAEIEYKEAVDPKVIQVCLQASDVTDDGTADTGAPKLPQLSADQVLDELEAMDDLNAESLTHVISNGHYKSVKSWATARLAELNDD